MTTCPHCVGLQTHDCCLCHGSRQVPDDPAACAWLWAYTDCRCAVCQVLLRSRADSRPRPVLVSVPSDTSDRCQCGAELLRGWPDGRLRVPLCGACFVKRDYDRKKARKELAHVA